MRWFLFFLVGVSCFRSLAIEVQQVELSGTVEIAEADRAAAVEELKEGHLFLLAQMYSEYHAGMQLRVKSTKVTEDLSFTFVYDGKASGVISYDGKHFVGLLNFSDTPGPLVLRLARKQPVSIRAVNEDGEPLSGYLVRRREAPVKFEHEVVVEAYSVYNPVSEYFKKRSNDGGCAFASHLILVDGYQAEPVKIRPYQQLVELVLKKSTPLVLELPTTLPADASVSWMNTELNNEEPLWEVGLVKRSQHQLILTTLNDTFEYQVFLQINGLSSRLLNLAQRTAQDVELLPFNEFKGGLQGLNSVDDLAFTFRGPNGEILSSKEFEEALNLNVDDKGLTYHLTLPPGDFRLNLEVPDYSFRKQAVASEFPKTLFMDFSELEPLYGKKGFPKRQVRWEFVTTEGMPLNGAIKAHFTSKKYAQHFLYGWAQNNELYIRDGVLEAELPADCGVWFPGGEFIEGFCLIETDHKTRSFRIEPGQEVFHKKFVCAPSGALVGKIDNQTGHYIGEVEVVLFTQQNPRKERLSFGKVKVINGLFTVKGVPLDKKWTAMVKPGIRFEGKKAVNRLSFSFSEAFVLTKKASEQHLRFLFNPLKKCQVKFLNERGEVLEHSSFADLAFKNKHMEETVRFYASSVLENLSVSEGWEVYAVPRRIPYQLKAGLFPIKLGTDQVQIFTVCFRSPVRGSVVDFESGKPLKALTLTLEDAVTKNTRTQKLVSDENGQFLDGLKGFYKRPIFRQAEDQSGQVYRLLERSQPTEDRALIYQLVAKKVEDKK